MKQLNSTILLIMLLCMFGVKANAHDIEVKNADGVTIYYVWTNNKTELAVTYPGQYFILHEHEYEENVVIPQSVEYNGATYSVTSITSCAFYECFGLTSVTIPNSVTSIGSSAFYHCISLTSVTIPNSVTCIEGFTFSGCSRLTSITLPNSVTSIEKRAFQDCSGLTSITIPNSVTSIGSGAFENCSGLTSITIPNSVTSIGSEAFINTGWYNNLSDGIIYHDNCLLGYKGSSPTWNLSIKAGTRLIAGKAFYGCSGLTSVTIPNSVTSIGYSAFSGCSGLASVTIPNSVTSIEGSAFSGCFGLTSVTIPNNVTTIGDSAFEGCSGLTSVTIPNSVTSIGASAFSGCSGLTSITIGNGVETIYSKAFANCPKLTDVYCYAENVPNMMNYNWPCTDAFVNSNIDNATLHVSAASINAYKTTVPWNNFKKIVKIGTSKYTLTYIIDGEEYKTYEIEEGDVITSIPEPTKDGYTFSGWSEIPETMPAEDVTVTGTFTINKYKLIYKVDGEIYKTIEKEYGASITPEAAPTKTGYTFSGWNNIPSTMPAKDVTVTGSFTVNKYKLTYKVDGTVYKTYQIEYGASITSEAAPTKVGYTFSGWSYIPSTMPAEDVTVTGTFTVNKYKLIYMVDGAVYKTYEIEYGANIALDAEPTKEGYTFSGWSWAPGKMPAEDVTVTGTFTVNKYKLIYKVDGSVYKTYEIEYGANIALDAEPTKEGYTFSGWSWIPSKMPAEDVTVTGTFTINKYKVTYMIDGEVYKTEEVEYGATITPPNPEDRSGYDFAWGDYPSTMPAKDITITGSYTVGIKAILATESDVKIYTVSGKPIKKLQKGVNIIRTRDGKTKKVMVK